MIYLLIPEKIGNSIILVRRTGGGSCKRVSGLK